MEIILVTKVCTITEFAQFTEYPKGGFYDWHMDADIELYVQEPPVRKISMTISAFSAETNLKEAI